MEFHGIPWNSMELFGGKLKVPWNSMEFHGTREYGKSTMEFHGTLDLDKIPWNSMELLVSAKLAHSKFHGIPWNCLCQWNWRTPSSMELHGIPWNCSCQWNWRTPSSMEFHGTARVIKIGALEVPWNSMELLVSVPWNSMEPIVCYLMEPLVSSIHWVLKWYRILWNLSFKILMITIFNCARWINFHKLIKTLYLFASLFHQLMFYYKYLHYTLYAFPALLIM